MSRLCLLLLLSLPTGAQQSRGVIINHPTLADHGRVDGRIYSNNSLGLTYELPDGFFVNSNADDSMSGANVLLMVADQHTDRPWKNRLVMVATDAAQFAWTTEKFVAEFVTKIPAKLHVVVRRDTYRLEVGGEEFYRVDYQKTDEGKTLYESFICVRQKGFFISWTFVSLSAEEIDQIASSIKTVSFH